jgi:5-methylcytosine-specific restriction endonuclease McrA
MKYLAPPTQDDAVILKGLAADPQKDLRHYPAHVTLILAQYAAYVAAGGNAGCAHAPNPLGLPQPLKTLLRGYYSRREGALVFIREIKRTSKDVCPMCGSLGSSTVDHVFPKSIFAEFSFFSRNLVPACSECNSKRGNDYRGATADQRLAHPYFDTWLTTRVVMTELAPVNAGYQAPKISLKTALGPPGSPLIDTIAFHLETVIKRTDIDRFFSDFWTKHARKPERYFSLGPDVPTVPDIRNAVAATLKNRDDHFGTPNNWESMVYAGLLACPDAMDYIRIRVLQDRADPRSGESF